MLSKLEVSQAEWEMKEMHVTCNGTSTQMAYKQKRHRFIQKNASRFS